MGDVKSDEVVGPLVGELKHLLARFCTGTYSLAVDEFAPIARVDGEIWHWDFEGCEKSFWSRKGRYITADIGVPRQRWENKTPNEIRRYLFTCLKQALSLMVDKLKKGKADVDERRLFEDLAMVEKEFLR